MRNKKNAVNEKTQAVDYYYIALVFSPLEIFVQNRNKILNFLKFIRKLITLKIHIDMNEINEKNGILTTNLESKIRQLT